jgi:large subunit ribosomal protein L25
VSGDRIQLEVKEREAHELGSRHARRLRKQGLIPAVLFGSGHNRAIAVPERELRLALSGPSGLHAIVDVVVEGQKTPHHAVLKDYQQHPIRGVITHVDFHEVRLDQPIHASVVVHLVGESPGVKQGGVLQQVSRELNVEALPASIPERIEADVSGLELGGALRLEDLPPLEGVTFLDDPHETVLVSCTMPRGIAEAEEAEEGEEGEAAEGEAPAGGAEEAAADTEE